MTNEENSDLEKDSTCTTAVGNEPILLVDHVQPLSDRPLKHRVAIITCILMLSSEYAITFVHL
jgi:hypothetical protein